MKISLESYQKVAFWPLTFLSLFYLYVFCAGNFHLEIAERNQNLFETINSTTWLIFLFDYVVMLMLSKNKIEFVKIHVFHLVVIAVPFLRALRLALLILMLGNLLGFLKNRILVSIPIYVSVASALSVLIGAALVFDAEYQLENGNIRTPQDALWWASVTIFTVGYGDKFPVSGEGRFYAVALMLIGITIIGTVTATFAGWLVSKLSEVESENEKILTKLEEISSRLK